LDLTITDELRRAGLAREVVRAIQEARKNAGFEVSDRITLWWSSLDADVEHMWADHTDEIAGEVLATVVHNDLGGTVNVDVPDFPGSVGIARN
jgi:isoleucyl-tRNA synthetase